MRILVVQESDWLARGPHQSHHLMERLVARGHEVRVIDYQIDWKQRDEGLVSKRTIREGEFKVLAPGVQVIRPLFIRAPGLCYISLLLTHRLEIKRQLRDFKPDIVVGFGLLNANLAIRQCKRNNIPFIYYVIDELHRLVPEDVFQAIARYVESSNHENSTRVLAINEGLREYSEEMGADPTRTMVIRAGVDFQRFSTADGSLIRKKYGFSHDDVVMFFMGWLYNFSGLDDVAFELAQSKNDHLKMLVLGKGELWNRLHQIKEEYGLGDRLIMEDWKPYEEVPSYLAAADICLLPSQKNEIMQNIVPIKLYEYMAAGKPVICTSLSGVIKEFGYENGIHYIDRPDEAISMATTLIVNSSIDKEGHLAQQFVAENDWNVITSCFEITLNEQIKSNGT